MLQRQGRLFIPELLQIHVVFLRADCVFVSAQVLTKAGAEQQLLQRALDLKSLLLAALEKHRELQIDYKARVHKEVSGSLLFTAVPVLRGTVLCSSPLSAAQAWTLTVSLRCCGG